MRVGVEVVVFAGQFLDRGGRLLRCSGFLWSRLRRELTFEIRSPTEVKDQAYLEGGSICVHCKKNGEKKKKKLPRV